MTKRRWACAAAPGFVIFLATAIAAQIIHPHAVAATPISAYLKGPGSLWMQGAYYVLAVALALLAADVLSARLSAWRYAAGVTLVVAGCAVVVVAYTYSPWPLPGDPAPRLRDTIHVISAFVAFLCVTIAMFAATPLLWRGRLRGAFFALAAVVLALELAGVFAPAFAPQAYGAFEKLAIAGIVFWLIGASLALEIWPRLPGAHAGRQTSSVRNGSANQ